MYNVSKGPTQMIEKTRRGECGTVQKAHIDTLTAQLREYISLPHGYLQESTISWKTSNAFTR